MMRDLSTFHTPWVDKNQASDFFLFHSNLNTCLVHFKRRPLIMPFNFYRIFLFVILFYDIPNILLIYQWCASSISLRLFFLFGFCLYSIDDRANDSCSLIFTFIHIDLHRLYADSRISHKWHTHTHTHTHREYFCGVQGTAIRQSHGYGPSVVDCHWFMSEQQIDPPYISSDVECSHN